ncbi:DUF3784 domain-containing protein [Fictibacillus iocasae]|uniref:DUF3784 domain-containing protein n=1 Tax=Fictibacillus iocasae TaxID=2715437 RepID=A0ABW2NZ29_9BACL
MQVELMAIGAVMLLVSYMVGVRKQTWLLAGFNERNIKNKEALGTAAGAGFFLPLGLLLMTAGLIEIPQETRVLPYVILLLLLIVYVYIRRKLMK